MLLRWAVWGLIVASASPELTGNDLFEIGDIPVEWRKYAAEDIADMMGRWRLIQEESESIEDILSKLGVGWLKRRALRNYASVTEVGVTNRGAAAFGTVANLSSFVSSVSDDTMEPIAPSDPGEDEGGSDAVTEETQVGTDDRKEIILTTYFPYNHLKGGIIPLTGQPFLYKDSDTGYWTSVAEFKQGRLLQRRTSEEWGVMYDVRVVFTEPDIKKLKALVNPFVPPSPAPQITTISIGTTNASHPTPLVSPDDTPGAPPNEFRRLNKDETADGTTPLVALDTPTGTTTVELAVIVNEKTEEEISPTPEVTAKEAPLMLFRLTLVPKDSDGRRILKADRWSRKLTA